MSTQHTPGSWLIRASAAHGQPLSNDIESPSDFHCSGFLRNSLGYSSASYSNVVCTVHGDMSIPQVRANAHVLAAAPDLLDALKAVLSVADRKTAEFDLARAAIAKATGESA